jgi:hypothetical protein
MFYGLLICSDEECTDTAEAWGTLEELEAMACECGCAMHLWQVSEAGDEPVREAEPEFFLAAAA